MNLEDYADTNSVAEKISVATATYYNPDIESDILRASLARKSIRLASELGYEVIVVDGGSSEEFITDIEKYGAKIHMQLSRGMGSSKRQSIRESFNAGREIIAWTEPEKLDYIPRIIDTALPILHNSTELVVPRRKSLQSYPIAQQDSEAAGNTFWKKTTGIDLDMFFGPRTWRREISEFFLSYDGQYGDDWETLYIPVLKMIRQGKRVVEVKIDYTHPANQTELEENNPVFHKKRIQQLEQLIAAIENHSRQHNS